MKRLLCISLLLATLLPAERYAFRPYGEREGLLNPIVRMMAQDAEGFFWVVTAHGVYRFDGERMEYMYSHGLPITDVRWVHSSSDGATWFYSTEKIYRHWRGKFTAITDGEMGPLYGEGALQTISAGGGQPLWLIRRSSQLQRVNLQGQAEVVHTEPAGLWSVLVQRDGTALLGCGQTLCTYQQGVWTRLAVPPDRYVVLLEGRDGALYARGRKRILRRDPKATAFTDISAGLLPLAPDQSMPALATDFHHRLLTNTESGMARLEGGRWKTISEPQGLVDQMVHSIFVDREGGIWLGTANGVLRWLGDGAWRLLSAAEGLPRRGTDMAAQDKHGDVWVTAGPAGVYRGQQREGDWRFSRMAGLPAATALITVYRDDSVWVGADAGGILRRETATGRQAPVPGIDPQARVFDFSIDQRGRVVAVTSLGFYREKEPGVLELVVGGHRFFSLTEDAAGAMWLGGDGVIARVREAQVEFLQSSDGVEKNGIRAMHFSSTGMLWTGTWRMDGLRAYRVEGRRLVAQESTDVLPEKVSTFFIRRDRRNRVWTGNVRGMAYLESGRWHTFGRAQGLSSDQCTNACFLRDGTVWFATTGGLAQYTPPLDRGPLQPPAIVLKRAGMRFGPLPLTGAPEIPARENDLQVDYGVLSTSLDAPPNVRYRLAGDQDWRAATSRRLEFLNIAHGDYRLELAAQGLNGQWSAVPTVFSFRVLPFWWQTWWFRFGAVGALGGLAALGWNARLRSTQRQNLRQLRDMVDRYPGVVFVLDREGRFVLTNRRMEEYTLQEPNGLIGKRPRDVMTPANATNFENRFAMALEREQLWEYSEAYQVPGGERIFEISTFPLRDQRNEVESICAFATDVTERRRAERERDQARQRYEAFIRQTTEAIWRVEFEPPVALNLPPREFGEACYQRAVVREANEAAAEFFGRPIPELIGRLYSELRDPSLPRNRAADLAWYKAGFQLRDFESEIVDARGQTRILLANTVGIIEDGLLVRSWSTQRDVTEQRRLEEMVTNTARGVSAGTGIAFFDLLVAHLARSLQADCAVAAERGAGGEVHVLATAGSMSVPPLTVDWPALSGLKTYVQPELAGLVGPAGPDGLQSCTVIPLTVGEQPNGILLVGYRQGTPLSAQARAALDIFASRAGAELERLRIEREVLSYQEQLRALTVRTQQIMEYERAHFAREIHDETGQHLTAIKIGLSTLRNRVLKGAYDRALEQAAELIAITEDAVKAVRRVATELRPPALDQLGLAAAIRWQARETQQRMGIPIDCSLEEFAVEGEVAIAAFRILQECLTNVMRHAQAQHVDVYLRRKDDRLLLTISDDGRGFDVSHRSGGSLGLLGMNERAAGVGGTLKITSAPGEGTTVDASLPLTVRV